MAIAILADDHDKIQIKRGIQSTSLSVSLVKKVTMQRGEFNFITDIAIGKNGLCVHVVDAKNKRLQLIEGIDWYVARYFV